MAAAKDKAQPSAVRQPAANADKAAVPELTKEQSITAYREMLLIRRFEEKAGQLYGMGFIGGFCHLYIGQEAVVVEEHLRFPEHRGDGRELLGRIDGDVVPAPVVEQERREESLRVVGAFVTNLVPRQPVEPLRGGGRPWRAPSGAAAGWRRRWARSSRFRSDAQARRRAILPIRPCGRTSSITMSSRKAIASLTSEDTNTAA